ncbi:MAG: efflux RND transporter periplasmic adaptor subunit [Spirochaetes bacterium]|nr:efflux RND transporter periplasmic adaptor subunit [Spirochaetota bacterium]
MINKIFSAISVLILFSLISGCSAERGEIFETRSIAQIHEDEGVPVRTINIEREQFAVALRYSAALNGIAESSASAMVSDSVERIFFRVGDFVEKNTVIVQFPLNNPAANYFQAKAAYENSRETFNRIQQLYRTRGVSRQDFDNARTGYNVARANWDNVNQMVKVKAPISGVITRLSVRPAENVSPGDHLFTVTNYNSLVGRVWVRERDIARVREGLSAKATWEGNTITGRVTQVDRSLNPSRQAFGAFVEFNNREHKFLSGITADISILVHENNSAIVVDRKHILGNSGENYVFIAGIDNTPVKRYVKTGLQYGGRVEIIQGLSEGDVLITEGSRFITETSRVRIVAGE